MASGLFDLAGRRALVTGSSQGIGHALARGLAEHGAEAILNGRDASRLGGAVETLRAEGLKAEGSEFDVTIPEAVEEAIIRIEEGGPLDILINNAGMQFRAPLEEFPEDRFDELMRTNVVSAFLVGKAAARRMIPRRRGRIVNIASVQSELARPGIAPYTATKGAIRNLTRGMATDWARHGLNVNAIAPGYFRTPLNQALIDDPKFNEWLLNRIPQGRWGDVEELVGAAVFLCSEAGSYMNGHTLYVDGGITASI